MQHIVMPLTISRGLFFPLLRLRRLISGFEPLVAEKLSFIWHEFISYDVRPQLRGFFFFPLIQHSRKPRRGFLLSSYDCTKVLPQKAFFRLGAPYGLLSVLDSQSGDRQYLKVLCCTSLYSNPQHRFVSSAEFDQHWSKFRSFQIVISRKLLDRFFSNFDTKSIGIGAFFCAPYRNFTLPSFRLGGLNVPEILQKIPENSSLVFSARISVLPYYLSVSDFSDRNSIGNLAKY